MKRIGSPRSSRSVNILTSIAVEQRAPADRVVLANALRTLPAEVAGIELRADVSGDIDASWLRECFSGWLGYALRSTSCGGRDTSALEFRQRRLSDAARHFDLVDLELDTDLQPTLLSAIPPSQRIVSCRVDADAGSRAALSQLLQRLLATPARLYRVVLPVAQPLQALALLQMLVDARRDDLIVVAEGAAGCFANLLAPALGASLWISALPGDATPGILDPRRLVDDFGAPQRPSVQQLFGIASPQLSRSASTRLHNAGYRALGIAALYVPLVCESLDDILRVELREGLRALGMPLRGLTATAPNKEAAVGHATQASERCQAIAAANLLIFRDAQTFAESTDAHGVMSPLTARQLDVAQLPVAVVGCGGAGRAAAHVLRSAGAQITLVNRSAERARYAARLLALPHVALVDFRPQDFALIVNATPCAGQQGIFPFELERLDSRTILLDFVYDIAETPLTQLARARGLHVIDGTEILLAEVRAQFEAMTGCLFPSDSPAAVL